MIILQVITFGKNEYKNFISDGNKQKQHNKPSVLAISTLRIHHSSSSSTACDSPMLGRPLVRKEVSAY